MEKTVSINTRVDEPTKSAARHVLEDLGMNLSQGIVLFLRQVVFKGGIPFDIKLPNVPNKETERALEEAERGEGLRSVSSVDELFKELNACEDNLDTEVQERLRANT